MKQRGRLVFCWAAFLKGACLFGIAFLLLSPGVALAHHHGCVSSPENPSLILAIVGGAGALGLPYLGSLIGDWKRRLTGAA